MVEASEDRPPGAAKINMDSPAAIRVNTARQIEPNEIEAGEHAKADRTG